MRFSRIGDNLWQEWDGKDYLPAFADSIVYYTLGWVDLEQGVVLRALASTIQRDGVVDGIGAAYELLEDAELVTGWAAHVGGDDELSFWEEEYAEYTEEFDEPLEVTWVEINHDS